MKKIAICVILTLLISSILHSENRFDEQNILSSEEIKKALDEVKADSMATKKSFEEFIKDFEKIEGLFTFYRDNEEGTVFLEIKPEQFGKIYLCTMTRQSGDAYMFDASAQMWSFPFFFKKVYKRIQLIEKNLKFRADEPAMRNAIEKCFSNSIIASSKIRCKPQEATGAIIIDASDLFIKDIPNVEYSTERRKRKFSFDKANSYFGELKSFPFNTEIEVVLHYHNDERYNIYTLPDSRSMIHRYHYSLSTIPETNYTPRLADDRIGLFTTIYQDYTTVLTESPYVRYINRWHIEKENPKKKVSKAKNPIVFWLENTIPEEYRAAVKKGILLWNDAFEAIGIKDAIVVKEMPDDAEWDPADSRYNTICWIIQPGGGYAVGPSHANPFTGEIYDADIRISVDLLRFFFREYDEVVNPDGWIDGLNFTEWDEENIVPDLIGGLERQCQYSQGMAQQMAFGWSVLNSRGAYGKGNSGLKEFVELGITDLVVHEVGHTLGLRHNFKASTVYTSEQLQDKKFTKKNSISSSVMDYIPINIAPVDGKQGAYFQTQLGAWDYWVIEYAYSIFDQDEEQERLEEIASRCTEPLFDFGTDGDAFGFSCKGVDPLACMFDLGKDPITFYETRIGIVKDMWENISKNFEKEGESYKKMKLVFEQGLGEYQRAAHNACKFIGGLYTHRDHIGDPNGRIPFENVPTFEQRRALNFLMKNIISEDAFNFPPSLLKKLVSEKMSTFTGGIWRQESLDYPIHDEIGYIQSIIFYHLYNPLVLGRLLDNELKFNINQEKFTMAEMFETMQKSVWIELYEKRNINSFRRELQRMYIHCLSELLLEKSENIPHDAVSLARKDLVEIQSEIDTLDKSDLDRITKAHLEETSAKIQAVLSAQIQVNK